MSVLSISPGEKKRLFPDGIPAAPSAAGTPENDGSGRRGIGIYPVLSFTFGGGGDIIYSGAALTPPRIARWRGETKSRRNTEMKRFFMIATALALLATAAGAAEKNLLKNPAFKKLNPKSPNEFTWWMTRETAKYVRIAGEKDGDTIRIVTSDRPQGAKDYNANYGNISQNLPMPATGKYRVGITMKCDRTLENVRIFYGLIGKGKKAKFRVVRDFPALDQPSPEEWEELSAELDLDAAGYDRLVIGFGFMDPKAAEVFFKAPKLVKIK